MAPIEHHMTPICSHTAPIWCIQLTYSEMHLRYDNMQHQVPPISQTSPPKQLPIDAQGSHMAHMAPTWLPYGACGSHMVHSAVCMWLPHGAICLPYGAPGSHIADSWFPYGTHGSHMAPIWCMWLPYDKCSSQTVPTAPIWPLWLPNGACGSCTAPSAPTWCHAPPMWLLYGSFLQYSALVWLPYVTCGSQMAYTPPMWRL
jgi:hypothetical protein